MLRSALALAAKGVAVFPCRCRDKIPATVHGLKDATTDSEQITAWWTEQPDFNIAIATGAISKILLVDCDGPDAERELQQFELPPTVEAITARGRHLYFRYPEVPVRNSAGKVGRGIDIRADGGYVIAPPSIHPSGVPYRWAGARTIAAAPDSLLAAICKHSNGQTTPLEEWREIVAADIPNGQRDCTLTKIAGKLLSRRVDAVFVLGLMHCVNIARCKPPLPPEDIERIVSSIAQRELRKRGHHR